MARSSWSDGGARVHNITAQATPATYSAAFTSTDASLRYISDLPFVSSTNGYGPVERDRSNGEQGASDGRTLTINGKTYSKGIGAHAASDVRVTIPAGCTTFKAVIGVDDEVGANGSVRFEVYGDSTRLFRSAVVRGADPGQAVSVNVVGRSGLRLVVTRGGDNFVSDHADWANAKLNCG